MRKILSIAFLLLAVLTAGAQTLTVKGTVTDAEGQPVCCLAGYAIVYREYDAYNRVAYEKFYGTDGFAVMLEDGAVSYRYTYDDDGNLLQIMKYDFADHEVGVVEPEKEAVK